MVISRIYKSMGYHNIMKLYICLPLIIFLTLFVSGCISTESVVPNIRTTDTLIQENENLYQMNAITVNKTASHDNLTLTLLNAGFFDIVEKDGGTRKVFRLDIKVTNRGSNSTTVYLETYPETTFLVDDSAGIQYPLSMPFYKFLEPYPKSFASGVIASQSSKSGFLTFDYNNTNGKFRLLHTDIFGDEKFEITFSLPSEV